MGLGNREIWICYLNDDDREINGFFYCVNETSNYIQIKSGSNLITIPFHRILKIKERER